MKTNLKNIYHKQLFHPNFLSIFINPFYLIRKGMSNKISCLGKNISGKMLDFGCGHKPYKCLFPNVDEYIGVDFENDGHSHKTEQIDVFYDGNSLPFKSNSFDAVICTEVLEHVPDENFTLQLIKSVMKDDAVIILTVPFIWPEHELPFDFRRFTIIGICELLEKNGFVVEQQMKNGNSFSVIIQMWIMFLHELVFTKIPALNILINLILITPFTILGAVLSPLFYKCNNMYFNSIILAKKVKAS